MKKAFFTIGHSTRSVEEIVALMNEAGANMIADVRTIPRSHTNPQFNQDRFPESLARKGIDYQYFKKLGGLRGKSKNSEPSPNDFWENKSFRNYADYTATEEYRDGLEELLQAQEEHVCAIMCAEAVWWRCHRRIIADYLITKGMEVFHIMGSGKIEPAILNSAAVQMDGNTLVYKAENHKKDKGK